MKKLLTILTLALAACVSERQYEGPAAGQESEITMQAVVPAAAEVQTREVGTTKENWIDHINVLVFKTTGELIYNGKGRNIVRSGTNMKTITFKAVLPIGTQYDFVVLANSASLLGSLQLGTTTKAQVKALVQGFTADNTEGTNKWGPTAAMPMWDEQTLTLNTTSTPSFTLMRMLARVNVEYSPATGVTPNFKLQKVRYYNYNTSGMLIPSSRTVTVPTLPADPGKQLYQSVEYSSTDGTTCKELIYAFEAAHCGNYAAGGDTWAANPCLVVGGSFDANGDGQFTEKTTWYRIDFIRKTDGEWLSLLRNFSYGVVITSVNGAGYDDPDIALKSAPMNITAGVMDWDDGNVDEVIFDGTAYLAVNKHELTFPRLATTRKLPNGANSLAIKTDYTVNGFPERSGWTAKYYTDAECQHEMANPWLKLRNGTLIDKGPVTGDPDQPAADTWFEFTENTGTVNREAWVMIIAGRLRYRVHIVQKLLMIELRERIGSGTIEEAVVTRDSMLFIVPHDPAKRHHLERKVQVWWRPENEPLAVTMESPEPTNPFEPAWVTEYGTGYPMPVPPFTIPANTSPKFFLVEPPAVSDATLAKDPLYEKETRYWFKLTSHGETERVSISLRQVHFNIVIETHSYRLDGTTHALTVRSNTPWRIKTIEERLFNNPTAPATPGHPVMLNLRQFDNLRTGTTAGPNVTGDAVAFTTVDADADGPNKGKWGTVVVTFESPEGLFPDKVVELLFPPPTRLILGLGPGLDVRGYNIGIPTSYHLNSAFRMINSPYNFGSMDESIYQVKGLRVLGYNFMGAAAASQSGDSPDFLWHKNSIRDWLNDLSPDVIVISSNPGEPAIMAANDLRLLREYLQHGGVVIMCSHAAAAPGAAQTRTKNMLNALLGVTNFVDSDFKFSGTWGRSYLFSNAAASSPLLGGVFSQNIGGLAGKNWGSHSYTTGVRSTALPASVVRLSTMLDMSGLDSPAEQTENRQMITAFYDSNPNNRFLYIGNGCVMASYYDSLRHLDHTYDPFDIDDDLAPTPALDWGRGLSRGETYNAHFIANAIAWALSVTNHQPPTGKYQ